MSDSRNEFGQALLTISGFTESFAAAFDETNHREITRLLDELDQASAEVRKAMNSLFSPTP